MKVSLLQARALYLVQRVGPVGWCGATAVVLSASFLLGGRMWLDLANATLTDELSRLKVQLERERLAATSPALNADPVTAIVAQLPPADQVPAFVESVQTEAARRGLQIDRTEYRVQKELGGRVYRYQLQMPAHGTYPQLRAWLATLLHDFPRAGLDELSMRRASDGSSQLDARVSFAFYSQGVR